MRFEIDMQPSCPAISGYSDCFPHQLRSDSFSTHARANAGIQDESVCTAIPSNVDKANELFAVISADMRKASR